MAGRAYSTEAIVLRSIRLGEADRVLHLYTRANGRVGALRAKGRTTAEQCVKLCTLGRRLIVGLESRRMLLPW